MTNLLLAGVLLLAIAPGARALNLYTEDNPPLNFMHEGKLIGIAPGLVEETARRAQIEARVSVLPWKDAYARARDGADACVFSTVRTSERYELFQWVGPLTRSFWSAFALPDFRGRIATAGDLKKYRIGVVNDARADHLRKSGFPSIATFEADRDIPARLTLDASSAESVDLWITQGFMAQAIARQAGVPAVKEVFSSLMSQDYFIACGRRVPAEQVKALSSALAQMRKDGTYRRISGESIDYLRKLR